MSSIIAVKGIDRIVVGYDSAQLNPEGEKDDNAIVEKVFKHDKLDILFGVTGSTCINFMLRTMEFGRNLKDRLILPKEISINFITGNILEHIRKKADDDGYKHRLKESSILIIIQNRIFTITRGRTVTEFESAIGIGCGQGRYVFKTIKQLGLEMSAEEKVLCALRVIASCNVNAYAPFYVTNNATYDVKKFNE